MLNAAGEDVVARGLRTVARGRRLLDGGAGVPVLALDVPHPPRGDTTESNADARTRRRRGGRNRVERDR